MKNDSDNLLIRTLAAVLILPLSAAGLIPALILVLDPWRQPVFLPGIIVLIPGIVITGICIRDFYTQGGGTLAPWDPPEYLVVTGLYRFCRNPMYIGVLLLIIGLSLLFSSPLLLLYGVAAAAAFHLRVVKYEEPKLMAAFGQKWVLYSAMVNRWLPKIR
ncbi:MAG TPA: isoprenylcysteine carboxyl methyltransferase [Spirochaeta sp.]|nr:isoprenylcysteine carboxyl methyltransferase [Spirochaeta sp.]